MNRRPSIFKILFFLFIVIPVVRIVLGLRIKHADRLPENGPAVIVANHNSHLDAAVLMTLFPVSLLGRIKAVAAADYFLSTRFKKWVSTDLIGIIPVTRVKTEGAKPADPLAGVYAELAAGSIVLFFPEGSRGEPEQMGEFRFGIAKVAERFPTVPIIPVFLQGLGKSLPKGEGLLIPFFCDVVIGEPQLRSSGEEASLFVRRMRDCIANLGREVKAQTWDHET
jgi:1-acyl-sn-glycerol-3-phosphate acyltransferase